jgi:hypothetical protein
VLSDLRLRLILLSVVYYQYSSTLKDFRRLKGYRYGLFYICEDLIGFRLRDNNEYGIICDEMNVNIKVIFEKRENMFKFQSAIRSLTRKRSSHELQIIPSLENEATSSISSIDGNELIRIMTDDYQHEEGKDVSPPFSVTEHTHSHSESSSQQTEHVQNPATNPEITLQMIEPVDSTQFIGQIAEACHLQPKISHPSNFIFMSRLFHQHFDGIDCLEAKVPNMLIHYVTHQSSPEQTPVSHVTAYRTTVQIFFRNVGLFNRLLPHLKSGGFVVEFNGKTAYQLDLFFEDGNLARQYLRHKESATIKIWNDRDSDESFNFLID